MNKTVINNIYSDLLELSDINTQREYWLGKNTQHSSSYTELMCRLFDDNGFDEFVDYEARKYEFSDELIFSLKKLRDDLNLYGEKESDLIILEDTAWQKLSKQAALVVRSWTSEEMNREKKS